MDKIELLRTILKDQNISYSEAFLGVLSVQYIYQVSGLPTV